MIWRKLCTQLLCSSAWCRFSKIQLQGAFTTWNRAAQEAEGMLQPAGTAKHSWLGQSSLPGQGTLQKNAGTGVPPAGNMLGSFRTSYLPGQVCIY